MSTRSILAVPTDNGFKGRYSHSDGMPTSMVRLLFGIVERFGVDDARRILTEDHRGWSMIHPEPEKYHDADRLGLDKDGNPRAALVPHVGIAYSNAEQPDEWFTNTDKADWIAYAYVINDTGIAVFRNVGTDKPFEHAGNVMYRDELTDDVLGKLECGENYEHCGHYAWFHDARVPQTSRIGMSKWLGREPMTASDVTKVGAWSTQGSSTTGTADAADWRAVQFNPKRPRYQWLYVTAPGSDKPFWVRLGRITKAGVRLDEDVALGTDVHGTTHTAKRGALLPIGY